MIRSVSAKIQQREVLYQTRDGVFHLISKTRKESYLSNTKRSVSCHVCVPLRGTNMAAGNQQKHLSLSFPANARIYRLRNSYRLK